MIVFAYTECGLSIDQFFKLSWYEWSLEIEKVRVKKKRDFSIWEGNAALIRDLMALTANINLSKNSTPYKGSDFFKLSFDKVQSVDDVKRLTPDQVDKLIGKYIT